MEPITVAIVDDHPVVVGGVTAWIAQDPLRRITITGAANTIAELAEVDLPPADVLLLDLELATGQADGEIPRLAAAGRRVVVFSGHTDADRINKVIDLGACAFVAKNEAAAHLVATIVEVAADRPYVTPSHAKGILADRRPDRPVLSAQEQQVLLFWFQGMTRSSVGTRLSISENTVKQYISRARLKYAKLGRPAPTKDAMLARAIEDGLVKPADVGGYQSYATQADGDSPSKAPLRSP